MQFVDYNRNKHMFTVITENKPQRIERIERIELSIRKKSYTTRNHSLNLCIKYWFRLAPDTENKLLCIERIERTERIAVGELLEEAARTCTFENSPNLV